MMTTEDITIDPAIVAEIDVLERVIANRGDLSSETEETEAVKLTQHVKAHVNALEKQRKGHVEPMNSRVKQINGLFKPFTVRLMAVEAKLKAMIVASVQRRESANRAAIQAATQAAQVGGDATRHLDAIDDRALPPSTSLRQRWAFQVTDPALIPLEFWSPDPAKISTFLDRHTDFSRPPEIPGVAVTVEGSLTVRSGR